MPKRKAASKPSASGADSEDVMQLNGSPPEERDERPAKRTRGRPKSSPSRASEPKTAKRKSRESPEPKADDTAPKKTGRRGRPKGSRNSGGSDAQNAAERENAAGNDAHVGKEASIANSNDELDAPQRRARSTKSKAAPAATRGRKKAVSRIETDGEFEYTPTNRQQFKSPEPEKVPSPVKDQDQSNDAVPESQKAVEDSVLPDEPALPRSVSASPSKARLVPRPMNSPSKASEPELRRRIGDLTKKCDTLESRYNRLREIGVVQANANMEKLREHCEAITEDSNNLIKALRDELEAQRVLGRQTRSLQKQLHERDEEVARLKTLAEEATTQLSSSQTEAKALQTKLAAARNSASNLENAAAKGPSAAKNTPANRAQNTEVAQAVQLAQLKEEFYTDLTGLIIRDVKERGSDNLYDCIQTGGNGTLHFKLVVPHVSSADYNSAEFSYIPHLDENRDRELLSILPDYLTVEINFSRQQASKFYTRVIDTLNKRRASQG